MNILKRHHRFPVLSRPFPSPCSVHNFDVKNHQPPLIKEFTIQGNQSHQVTEIKLWQPNSILNPHEHPTKMYNYFIELRLHHAIRVINHQFESSDEAADVRNPAKNEIFRVRYSEFMQTLTEILFFTESIPTKHHGFIRRELSLFAVQCLAFNCKNCERRVRPFVIEIKNMRVEFIREMGKVRFDVSRLGLMDRCSICSLEEEDDGMPCLHCPICLDKFNDGFEVTRMPCLHVYHGDCIDRWLVRSRICPLCRSPIPRC